MKSKVESLKLGGSSRLHVYSLKIRYEEWVDYMIGSI